MFRIIADSNLLKAIPESWNNRLQVLQSPSETFTIHMEEIVFGKNEFPDGWNVVSNQGSKLEVYNSNGKILFAIEPGSTKDVKVYVGNTAESNIRLGIHYGIMHSLHEQCVGLHGVTLLCGNEIIILSAPSGTGKTTLAKLLEKYCDAIVINGDFALLKPTNEGVIFEPTPFCGTSGRSLNHRFRVNRVVFLSQANTNEWRELAGREAIMQFMCNAFVPIWDSSKQNSIQENILRCINAVKINAYAFAPIRTAAELFLKKISEDSLLYSE